MSKKIEQLKNEILQSEQKIDDLQQEILNTRAERKNKLIELLEAMGLIPGTKFKFINPYYNKNAIYIVDETKFLYGETKKDGTINKATSKRYFSLSIIEEIEIIK